MGVKPAERRGTQRQTPIPTAPTPSPTPRPTDATQPTTATAPPTTTIATRTPPKAAGPKAGNQERQYTAETVRIARSMFTRPRAQ